jgi:hypothetical protein
MNESHGEPKLTYTAPEIESLGTIAEITASGHGSDGSFDGSGYTSSSSPGGPHGS